MMALVKIAILLLVVFTATALENSHEIDSNHELHPYSSPEPSPSTNVDEQCVVQCAFTCQGKRRWQKMLCLGLCLPQCYIGPSHSLAESACAIDCAQSSTNNLRYDSNMMDDRISACTQQCKKD